MDIMSMFYPNMSKIIQKLTILKWQIDDLRPFSDQQNRAIQERLRMEWTYNSNAIEGNTLTFGETLFFLREGLTSEGRPLKDYLEAKNHAEAIEGLDEIIRSERPLTESVIKELHAVLMRGAEHTVAMGAHRQMIQKTISPGKYKSLPNHVLTVSGAIHHYADPLHVKDEMEKLISWYRASRTMDSVERAAIFHYKFVAIHPFDDGNGRLARLLMNLILICNGYPPCVIKNIHRKEYLKALEKVDKKKTLEPFIEFVAKELSDTLETVIAILEGREQSVMEPQILNREDRLKSILLAIKKAPLSISQISAQLPLIKRPTLKLSLQTLVRSRKLKRKGKGKGVVYFV